LALVSKTAGAPGDITITSNTSGLVFHKAVNGVNASLTVDGVPISSSSNTIAGAIPGLTLTLASAAPNTEAVLTITPDSDKASQAVRKFVDGYNAIIGSLNAQFAVNAASGSQGILAGNASVRTLQTSLLSNITYAMSGNNGLVNLASLGVEMANDGTLSIDDTKFNAAVGNQFTDVKNFFQSAGGTGFAQVFSNQLARIGSSVDGIVATGLNENSAVQRMLTDSITQFEDRMVVRRRQLITEYSRIDTMLRQYPLILAQITGQLSALSKS
jgi:flagellar hook-associated protein 2